MRKIVLTLPCLENVTNWCQTHKNACSYTLRKQWHGEKGYRPRNLPLEAAKCLLMEINHALSEAWDKFPDEPTPRPHFKFAHVKHFGFDKLYVKRMKTTSHGHYMNINHQPLKAHIDAIYKPLALLLGLDNRVRFPSCGPGMYKNEYGDSGLLNVNILETLPIFRRVSGGGYVMQPTTVESIDEWDARAFVVKLRRRSQRSSRGRAPPLLHPREPVS